MILWDCTALAKLAWWGVGGVKPNQFDTIYSSPYVIIEVSSERSFAVLPSHFARLFYLESHYEISSIVFGFA